MHQSIDARFRPSLGRVLLPAFALLSLLASPAAAELITLYELDQQPDTNVPDSVGDADGTLVNFAANPYVSGQIGDALSFDGSDDRVPLDFTYNSDSLAATSVSAWINTSSTQDQIIASTDRNEYWRFGVSPDYGTTGRVGWAILTDDGQVDFQSNADVNDGDWHHVVGVFDGATGAVQIYIDGALDAENVDVGRTAFGSGNLRYGFLGVGSEADTFDGTIGPGDYFDGLLDEVAIFDTALTAGEIQEIYSNGLAGIGLAAVPEPTSIAVWSLIGVALAGFGYTRVRKTDNAA